MEKHIYKAMADINTELDVIEKDQQGHGYKFRGINQVMNALKPLMAKNKVIVRRENVEVKYEMLAVPGYQEGKPGKTIFRTTVKADYVFTSCVDGSELRSVGFGEGIDNASFGDKSSSMATSNAYKYVIFEMFNIAVEEQQDSDQETAEKAKKESKFEKKEDAPVTKFSQPAGGKFKKDEPKTEEKSEPKPETKPVEKVEEKQVVKEPVKETPAENKPVEQPKEQPTDVKKNIEQKKSRFAR